MGPSLYPRPLFSSRPASINRAARLLTVPFVIPISAAMSDALERSSFTHCTMTSSELVSTGRIEMYKGKPEIRINAPEQTGLCLICPFVVLG